MSNRQTVIDTIKKLRGEGKDFGSMAEALNKKGWKTKTGKAWNVANVRYVYHTAMITSQVGKRAQSGGKPKSDPNAVKLILELHKGGSTPAVISDALTENGYKTATGVPWNKDNVRKLIQVYRANPPEPTKIGNGHRHIDHAFGGRKGAKRAEAGSTEANLQQVLGGMFERFDQMGIHIGSVSREGGKIEVTYLARKTESFEQSAAKAA